MKGTALFRNGERERGLDCGSKWCICCICGQGGLEYARKLHTPVIRFRGILHILERMPRNDLSSSWKRLEHPSYLECNLVGNVRTFRLKEFCQAEESPKSEVDL